MKINIFGKFKKVAGKADELSVGIEPVAIDHPFDIHNIDSEFPPDVKRLFDNGHYPQATFEAMKFLENEVKRHSGLKMSGLKLMMDAFNKDKTHCIKLNALSDQSEEDEQDGFRFLFAGAIQGIRNPRGHSTKIVDDPDSCLSHLNFISFLLRCIRTAGYS